MHMSVPPSFPHRCEFVIHMSMDITHTWGGINLGGPTVSCPLAFFLSLFLFSSFLLSCPNYYLLLPLVLLDWGLTTTSIGQLDVDVILRYALFSNEVLVIVVETSFLDAFLTYWDKLSGRLLIDHWYVWSLTKW